MSNDPVLYQLGQRYPSLISCMKVIEEASEMIIRSYSNGGKLLVCGNGGSSSDADHIVGELMKSFESNRPVSKDLADRLADVAERGKYLAQKLECGLPAISLSSQTVLTTAIVNDIDSNMIFAQQVLGYGQNKDVLIAISCSGNSQNIIDACITAKALKLKIIGLTGMTGGKMKQYCDVLINVPEKRTAWVQELHLPILHALCLQIENHFFSNHK
jgi:phosphoheptose isomerase